MRRSLLIVILCFLCFSCASGSKNVVDPYSGYFLQKGESMAIVVTPPFSSGDILTPEYLTSNIAKILRPACVSVVPAGLVADDGEGLAFARQNNLGYVLFLHVENWSAGSVAGTKAKLFVRLMNVSDGNIIAAAIFEDSESTVNILYSSGDPWQAVAKKFQEWTERIVFYTPKAGAGL